MSHGTVVKLVGTQNAGDIISSILPTKEAVETDYYVFCGKFQNMGISYFFCKNPLITLLPS